MSRKSTLLEKFQRAVGGVRYGTWIIKEWVYEMCGERKRVAKSGISRYRE